MKKTKHKLMKGLDSENSESEELMPFGSIDQGKDKRMNQSCLNTDESSETRSLASLGSHI